MEPARPSRTALGAARHRAAHQVLERGAVFTDPLALRILGDGAADAVAEAERDPSRRRLRLFIAVRSRFAEDALAAAMSRGVRQLVVLGAGLDTAGYRAADDLRVFEVDHPATQAWKRRLLDAAGIAVPRALTFVPVDFERESLPARLGDAAFDAAKPTFFTWLGVVPYLTDAAIFATLGFIAAVPGAEVVFDYANPPGPDSDEQRALAERVAAVGEELRSCFDTARLHARLRAVGFRAIEDLGPAAMRVRYFGGAVTTGDDSGGHILRAST